MPAADNPARLASYALLAANFLIGLTVVAPAGMIDVLSSDLGEQVSRIALLFTVGAVVVSIGSPLVAWAFAATDKRALLAVSLGMLALTHLASAAAPDLTILIVIRVAAMAFASVVTPQAAGAVAMMVPERARPTAISFVFIGWSLATAVGLPAITWLVTEIGWRNVHLALFAIGLGATIAVAVALPSGLRGAAMSLRSWGALLTNKLVLLLLAITVIAQSGQFLMFPFFGPLLGQMAGATPHQVALCFALFGGAGFAGNVVGSALVGRLGTLHASLLFFATMLAGATIWTIGMTALGAVAIASFVWGIGFAASNSMQQARLAGAAPALAGAAIALNSSGIYVGQAFGSAVGAAMFDAALYRSMGWVTVAFLLITLVLVWLSGRMVRSS